MCWSRGLVFSSGHGLGQLLLGLQYGVHLEVRGVFTEGLRTAVSCELLRLPWAARLCTMQHQPYPAAACESLAAYQVPACVMSGLAAATTPSFCGWWPRWHGC